MSPKTKKLVLISATSTLVTEIREKAVKTIEIGKTAKVVEIAKAVETAGASKDDKESENGENLRSNLT